MSGPLPVQLDPIALAMLDDGLAGTVSLLAMERLKEATERLVEHDARVNLRCSKLGSGIHLLTGVVSARVQMICQRCLGLANINIDRALELALVNSDVEAALIQDDYETHVLDKGCLVTRELIEDELLLSLPIIPRHAHESDCDPAMLHILRRISKKPSNQPSTNPFEVLKNLKLN
jgi:uncharacterized protein